MPGSMNPNPPPHNPQQRLCFECLTLDVNLGGWSCIQSFKLERFELEANMPTHFQGDAETVRALSAYINLIRASDSTMAKTTAHLEGLGVTPGQFGVLEALLHLGPMCQHTLGREAFAQRGQCDAGGGQSGEAWMGSAGTAGGGSPDDANLADAERAAADHARVSRARGNGGRR